MNNTRRTVIKTTSALGTLVALGLITMVVVKGREQSAQVAESGTGQPMVGGPFTLTNQDGQVVQEAYTTLAGRSEENGESGFNDGSA